VVSCVLLYQTKPNKKKKGKVYFKSVFYKQISQFNFGVVFFTEASCIGYYFDSFNFSMALKWPLAAIVKLLSDWCLCDGFVLFRRAEDRIHAAWFFLYILGLLLFRNFWKLGKVGVFCRNQGSLGNLSGQGYMIATPWEYAGSKTFMSQKCSHNWDGSVCFAYLMFNILSWLVRGWNVTGTS